MRTARGIAGGLKGVAVQDSAWAETNEREKAESKRLNFIAKISKGPFSASLRFYSPDELSKLRFRGDDAHGGELKYIQGACYFQEINAREGARDSGRGVGAQGLLSDVVKRYFQQRHTSTAA